MFYTDVRDYSLRQQKGRNVRNRLFQLPFRVLTRAPKMVNRHIRHTGRASINRVTAKTQLISEPTKEAAVAVLTEPLLHQSVFLSPFLYSYV